MASSHKSSWGLVIALALLIGVVTTFVIAFVIASQPPTAARTSESPDVEVQAALLLAQADPERGSQLVVAHQCVNCHVYAAGIAAPGWNGVAERAAQRESPLSAPAYLYEAIIDPMAYVVEGYAPAMPQNFGETLTPEETGDIIAYLLTLHASS